MNTRKDLTTGNVYVKLITYFLPLAAGNVFQQLYYAADALIVGRYAGTLALAAVGGSASSVSVALVGFFFALCSGGTILIAQFFGAKNYGALKKAVQSSVIFSVMGGLMVSFAAYHLTDTILVLTKVPSESFALSKEYMQIILAGLIFTFVFNMCAGILRAVGDSRTPFVIVSISCLINIAGDYYLIAVRGMGVRGAAIATVFSQFVCAFAVLAKLSLSRDEAVSLKPWSFNIDFSILLRMLAIGVPLALQSVMYSVTNIASQVCINILGTTVVAAWGLLGRMDAFFWAMMSSANITVSNFAGQNYGKKDFARMKEGLKKSLVIFELVAIVYGLILVTFSRSIVPWFDPSPAVVDATVTMIMCFAPFYPIWVINEVFSGSLRGEGKTLVPFFILMFSVCIYRLVWMQTVFAAHTTIRGLAMCYPTSWTIADICMVTYYFIHTGTKRPDLPEDPV